MTFKFMPTLFIRKEKKVSYRMLKSNKRMVLNRSMYVRKIGDT